MRKIISLALTVALALSLVACGGSKTENTENKEQVIIQFWNWFGTGFQDFFEDEAVLFQKENPKSYDIKGTSDKCHLIIAQPACLQT